MNGDKLRCAVDGCEQPHHGQGLCGPHYQAWRRTGERPELSEERLLTVWQEQQLMLGFIGEGVPYPLSLIHI